MDRTVLKEREKILKIMSDAMDNQPMASERTRNGYSALQDAIEEYCSAVQEDAFYWGYMTAMKQCKKVEVAG